MVVLILYVPTTEEDHDSIYNMSTNVVHNTSTVSSTSINLVCIKLIVK